MLLSQVFITQLFIHEEGLRLANHLSNIKEAAKEYFLETIESSEETTLVNDALQKMLGKQFIDSINEFKNF
jgi:hypothetical protein